MRLVYTTGIIAAGYNNKTIRACTPKPSEGGSACPELARGGERRAEGFRSLDATPILDFRFFQ
jgi:hypothetical protein